jgi:hypothetical protein
MFQECRSAVHVLEPLTRLGFQKQDKARAAAWEKMLYNPPPLEEMVKELAFGLEWVANAKAPLLSAMDALKNAIESGDLPHPPEHMHTHKSQKESLACDICHGWIKRRDAIMQQALPPRIFQDAKSTRR